MYRIGILGSENSHAMAFTEIFNGLKPELAGEFDDIRVVAVGGKYPEESRKVAERGGIEYIVDKPEDMLGLVDAVMVTARDGRQHAPYVRPFLEAGLPAFIDKPFTRDPQEALALVRLAKEKKVPLVGGSSVKLCAGVQKLRAQVLAHPGKVLGGDMTAPVSMVNDYGDFWFYAAHLAESCLATFGYDPQWIWASRHRGGVTAVVHYEDYEVTNHFLSDTYCYSGTVNTREGCFYEPLDISDIYALECRSFARMLRTGEMDFTYEQLLKPVDYIAAIEKSFWTGARQMLPGRVL